MKPTTLTEAIGFYLTSRRQLGFELEAEGFLPRNLAAYARQSGHRGPLTSKLVLDWAQVPPPTDRARRARRLASARRFATFWVLFDPRTQLPPAGLFGPAHSRRPVHIYSPGELADLLAATQTLPSHSLCRLIPIGI